MCGCPQTGYAAGARGRDGDGGGICQICGPIGGRIDGGELSLDCTPERQQGLARVACVITLAVRAPVTPEAGSRLDRDLRQAAVAQGRQVREALAAFDLFGNPFATCTCFVICR